jgi:phosphatidylglycerol:prolipoprotein diacylglycerol transferase
MIPYKVFHMFRIGPLRFNLYGIMFAAGFGVATLLAVKEAAKEGIEKDTILDLTVRMLAGAIVGARLFYVLFYWPAQVPLTFWDVFKIWEGGVAFFGGFLGGLTVAYLYVRRRGLKFWKIADVYTLPLIVGHIFGRIGDYLTGGHPGKITDVPWAIYLQNAFRHPVVLYEIAGLIIIGVIILILKKIRRFEGFLFLIYVQLYAIQRMVLDFFRIESTDPRTLGLTPTQYVVVILFVSSACFMVRKYLLAFRAAAESRKEEPPS